MYLYWLSAQSIHISEEMKITLDNIGSFVTQPRGHIEIKVLTAFIDNSKNSFVTQPRGHIEIKVLTAYLFYCNYEIRKILGKKPMVTLYSRPMEGTCVHFLPMHQLHGFHIHGTYSTCTSQGFWGKEGCRVLHIKIHGCHSISFANGGGGGLTPWARACVSFLTGGANHILLHVLMHWMQRWLTHRLAGLDVKRITGSRNINVYS
jgi:hypothetical protein